MLSEIENENGLTSQSCAAILHAVHQVEGDYPAQYSNIFDPVHIDIYFNFGVNYQNQKKINLLDIFNDKLLFEKKSSFFRITGINGHLLVKSVRMDENFYYPLLPPVFYIIISIGTIAFGIILGIDNYQKKKKIVNARSE
ncbi:MAG: hypothetical protein ACTSV5_13830 [Promethearchaeota archaeon]